MIIPKARKLPSGQWSIQLRLSGQSVTITKPTKKQCEKEAAAVKAEYNLGIKNFSVPPSDKTLTEAIDSYIEARQNTLSPLTIRGYRTIQKYRFQSIMKRKVSKIQPSEWQAIVDNEAGLCSQKTLKNAWGFIRSVVESASGNRLPKIQLSTPVPHTKAFLQPEEILPFVNAVKNTKYEIPLLLALSSLRISEINALKWEDIPPHTDFIPVRGAKVLNEDNHWIEKQTNKNYSSSRNVPILIPSLAEALERDRLPSGPVLNLSQNALRCALHNICKKNNLTDVTPHGLRHSFASLGYHLRIPEEIIMEIGGWSDRNTMLNIYTHIAHSDISRYQNALYSFYSDPKSQNANENANANKDPLRCKTSSDFL